MSVILWFLLSCALLARSRGEYFSAVDKLSEMGELEADMVTIFNHSIETMLVEHETYFRFFESVRAEHDLAKENVEKYLSNPINAYRLIKRMNNDWLNLKENLLQLKGKLELQEEMQKLREEVGIPTEDDIGGGARGILRMQVYNDLKPEDLAAGIINGTDYGDALDWEVCYEVAKEIYGLGELLPAKQWFTIALDKLPESSSELLEEREVNVHEFLGLINYELGLNAEALLHVDKILNDYPEHPVKQTKFYMQLNPKADFVERESDEVYRQLTDKYFKLCRGLQDPDPQRHKLKCKLSTKNNPYFILAPLQMEILNAEPELVVYHRVLTDRQIDDILAVAAEQTYFRSQIRANKSDDVVSELRVSQQTWVYYEKPVMIKMQKTLALITGFNLTNSECMQVVSYGVGGQYDQHNDNFFPTYDEVKDMPDGDRIATNMFYFSDVEQGGYTVFPNINTYSRPVKGSLIVWHNLLRSLDGDLRTRHAGCPVLKGVKRIGNIWVRSGFQNNRPCGLNENDAFVGF